jgi:hypothetical protein
VKQRAILVIRPVASQPAASVEISRIPFQYLENWKPAVFGERYKSALRQQLVLLK